MKYRLIITQLVEGKSYTDDIVAEFEELEKLFVFLHMAFESCKSIKAKIEMLSEEGEE